MKKEKEKPESFDAFTLRTNPGYYAELQKAVDNLSATSSDSFDLADNLWDEYATEEIQRIEYRKYCDSFRSVSSGVRDFLSSVGFDLKRESESSSPISDDELPF